MKIKLTDLTRAGLITLVKQNALPSDRDIAFVRWRRLCDRAQKKQDASMSITGHTAADIEKGGKLWDAATRLREQADLLYKSQLTYLKPNRDKLPPRNQ